ncbi:MAG TPA: hypothetical protein VGK26_09695 [Thermoanaerobaculia bacterium]|jgi:hypothetical protein
MRRLLLPWTVAATLLLLTGFGPSAAREQDADAAAGAASDPSQGDPQWPRVIEEGDLTFNVYQPQIDVFSGTVLEARAAVEVDEKVEGGKTRTLYGVIWIKANTFVDKEARLVQLDDIEIPKGNFPTAEDRTDEFLGILRNNTEPGRTVSLDRVEANLAMTQSEKKGEAVPIKNDPPRIYYRTSASILILIDGEPALRDVEGSGLQRVLNTRSLILKDASSFYTPIGDRWASAPAVTGPWRLAAAVPPAAQSLRDSIAKDENQSQTDLIDDPGDAVKAVLSKNRLPDLIVSTEPAELIETDGAPEMKPIAGTQLLYVSNTTGDILLDLNDQSYYVPLTGRWFRGKSLDGPWQFVNGDALPKDFAKIPTNNPKSNVLATVPGTPASQEAVIANSIPQTAEVDRAEAKFESSYDGEPDFQPVPDTSLQYALNTPTPVIRVDPTSFYAVQGGVWFNGGSPYGPWVVATAVPPPIYAIPVASPIHYVTYVRIYRYSPTYVWVGYTPGYLGTCYSPWGTVVYGTGYWYRPWIGRYWYGAPVTWGYGVGISWNPWSGWNVGFGWGGYRPYYRPYWGPYYGWHRPPGWYVGRPVTGRPVPYSRRPGITNVNLYNRPGIARPGVKPVTRPPASTRPAPGTRPGPGTARPGAQPVPGTRPAPSQPGTRPAPGGPTIQPVPGETTTGRPGTRPAPSRPDNVYAGKDGQVYRPRPGGGGWETPSQDGKWKPVTQPAERPQARPAPQPAPGRPAQESPQARPKPPQAGQPARPSVDPGTLNQLSRDRQARDMGNMRAGPPPSSRPAPSSKPAPSSSRPQPAPRQQKPPR